jgi:hypothetical protein
VNSISEPRIDFSEFHPLDHRPWERRCWSLYGGPWNHLRLAWTYRHKDELLDFFYKHWLCPLGRHRMVEMWVPDKRQRFQECQACGDPAVRHILEWDDAKAPPIFREPPE